MRESTPWKIATLILAITTLVLIVREVSETPPVPAPHPPAPLPGEAEPTSVSLRPDPVARSEDDDLRDLKIVIGGGSTPPDEEPPPSDEELRDYLMEWVVAPTPGAGSSFWRSSLRRLERYKYRVVPMLEGWLRRAEELKSRGIGLTAAVAAYAHLAGPEALPLLRELRRTSYRHSVPKALIRIDSGEAAEFLAEILQADRPGTISVSPADMMEGSEPVKALVRQLAEGHSEPGPRRAFRHALFRYGTEEDREKVWNTTPGGEDLRSLYSSIPTRWEEKWQERCRTTVLDQIGSPVEYLRYAALTQLARFPKRFGAEWTDRARAAIEAEISERPGGAVRKKRLEKLLAALTSNQRNEARAREVRELLGD